jgi:heme/copper-type cytochrome/quinol oxidase subunit 2
MNPERPQRQMMAVVAALVLLVLMLVLAVIMGQMMANFLDAYQANMAHWKRNVLITLTALFIPVILGTCVFFITLQ